MMAFSYDFIKYIDFFFWPPIFYYKFFANFDFPICLLKPFFLHCFANTSLLFQFSLKHFNLPFSQASHFVTSCLYF